MKTLKKLDNISCPTVQRAAKSFANLNFVGPCNLACKFCIATLATDIPQLQGNCLHKPITELPNLMNFLAQMKHEEIPWIMLTGLNTEPLLYDDLQNLINTIHAFGLKCALRSNGVLFFEHKQIVNSADKISYSIHTLNPQTALLLVGNDEIPDWENIFAQTTIPTKVNVVICPENQDEINDMIVKFAAWGLKRLSLREAFGFEATDYELPTEAKFVKSFCGNNVYDYKGMEITLWDVCETQVDSYNYIASTGEVFGEYRLWDIMKQAVQ